MALIEHADRMNFRKASATEVDITDGSKVITLSGPNKLLNLLDGSDINLKDSGGGDTANIRGEAGAWQTKDSAGNWVDRISPEKGVDIAKVEHPNSEISLEDDRKVYLGSDSDYSLYYDSTNDEYVLYDEVNAVKLLRLPKNTTIASSLEDGGANELTAENLSTGLADGKILEASGGTFVEGSKGGIFSAVTTQTADYTASSGDVVLADASGGAITITLPSPSANAWVQVKKTDSSTNAVTVDGGGNNIDGSGSFDITTQYESYTMVGDGSNWFIV